MEKDWTKIFSSSNTQQVEIRKALLTENNIESVIINKQDSSYPVFGLLELYVNNADAFKAVQLLNANDIE
jgi:hypothetical protein